MPRRVPPGMISPKGALRRWDIEQHRFSVLMRENDIEPEIKQGNNSVFYPIEKVRPVVKAYLRAQCLKLGAELEAANGRYQAIVAESARG